MNFSDIQSILTDEEQILIKRTAELRRRAEAGSPAFSGFLSPRERFILEQLTPVPALDTLPAAQLTELDSICFFWGGFPDAQRTLYCAVPAYSAYALTGETASDYLAELARSAVGDFLCVIRIQSSGYTSLSHRDYLGALVGLGIDRATLGDILTDDKGAYVFCTKPVSELIRSELTQVGRDTVRVKEAVLPDGFTFTCDFEPVTGTVASARLDSVVSELARTSRENAKELIRRGLVEHNYFPADACDALVSGGDVIAIRRDSRIRFGKYIVDTLDERTSKGRVRLAARKYS